MFEVRAQTGNMLIPCLSTATTCKSQVKASAGQTLINEGEKGDNFYIVNSGTFAAHMKQVPGKSVKAYAAGDSFRRARPNVQLPTSGVDQVSSCHVHEGVRFPHEGGTGCFHGGGTVGFHEGGAVAVQYAV